MNLTGFRLLRKRQARFAGQIFGKRRFKILDLYLEQDSSGRKILTPPLPAVGLNGKKLEVAVHDGSSKRVYPIYQQKAGTYGNRSEYMTRHGCACCSLTTVLAAFCKEYASLRPENTIAEVESSFFPRKVWEVNYRKPMARQMPVSLYGISRILSGKKISHRYVERFTDEEAEREIRAHLYAGRPVIVETSRIRRNGRGIRRFFDKKYAGSYHTMILLGIDAKGKVVFTDSATRTWAGAQQRLKRTELKDMIAYMFSRKNMKDRSVYFNGRKNTGGYILLF